jgi:hypothetical protein
MKLTYQQLGKILLREVGENTCQIGYGTTDLYWVGYYGLAYGDINPDGSLN